MFRYGCRVYRSIELELFKLRWNPLVWNVKQVRGVGRFMLARAFDHQWYTSLDLRVCLANAAGQYEELFQSRGNLLAMLAFESDFMFTLCIFYILCVDVCPHNSSLQTLMVCVWTIQSSKYTFRYTILDKLFYCTTNCRLIKKLSTKGDKTKLQF